MLTRVRVCVGACVCVCVCGGGAHRPAGEDEGGDGKCFQDDECEVCEIL